MRITDGITGTEHVYPYRTSNPVYPQGTGYHQTETAANTYARDCERTLGVPMTVEHVGENGR